MIGDWLVREGWIVLSWWLLASLAGAAALPLTFSLLRSLPDRGYTLARALGLLLTGFIFWLGTSLGLMINTPGSMVLAWLILAGCGAALFLRRVHDSDWRAWWRANRRFILLAELLFLVALLALALLRAHNNSLHGTEKPMELAFLSATQRSASFPPADPWFFGPRNQLLLFRLRPDGHAGQPERHRQHARLQHEHRHALCVGRPDSLWRRRQPGAHAAWTDRAAQRVAGGLLRRSARQLAAAPHRIALANWPRHGCLVRVLGPAFASRGASPSGRGRFIRHAGGPGLLVVVVPRQPRADRHQSRR